MSAKAKVSGSAVAGFPSPTEQYQELPLDLNELLVKRPAATYFVRVEGDSMVGAGISDGDLLVVDRSLRPADGDVIIASVDGDFTVKTYRRAAPAAGRLWWPAERCSGRSLACRRQWPHSAVSRHGHRANRALRFPLSGSLAVLPSLDSSYLMHAGHI